MKALTGLFLLGFLTGSPTLLSGQELFVCKKWHPGDASGDTGWFGRNLRSRQNTLSSENFDVHYYRAYWEADPAVRAISGKVGVYFRLTADSDRISLDLHSDLDVFSVSSNGQPLAYSHTGHKLEITLSSPQPADSRDSVLITYGGTPPVTGFNAFQRSTHGSPPAPVLFTLSEPFGSRDWWPCKNGLDDKADSVDIFIRHPAGADGRTYRAVANGMRQSETAVEDGAFTVVHWKHKYPIASYLVAIAVSDYTVFGDYYDINGDQLFMETYCFPQSQAVFQNGAGLTMDMMRFFSTKFGPYPFAGEKYGHTQFTWSGGMEHQTNSFMVNMSSNLVAHELAHQWFGNKITCGSWEDIWLNEGFASYLTSLYHESINPWESSVNTRRGEINYITGAPGGSVRVDDTTNPNRIFDSRLSYYKGAHLLFMLQWILGDEAFFEAVGQYLDDPELAYGYATTTRLREHLEATSGRDLGYFFEQWYEGEGFPSFHVTWSPTGGTVRFTVQQTTSAPSSVSFFRLPIPLLFTGANPGESKLVVVDPSANNQLFEDELGFEAVSVSIDPDAWLISRNNTATKTETSLPVRFREISSTCENGGPLLYWSVSDEYSVSHYSVQFSVSAGNEWHTVAEIPAREPSGENTYRYRPPDRAEGYYRIVQYDIDGTGTTSPITATACDAGEDGLVLSPNPVNGILKLSPRSSLGKGARLTIVDQNGKIRLEKRLLPGENPFEWDISLLPAGVYHVVTESPGSAYRKSRKIVKQ